MARPHKYNAKPGYFSLDLKPLPGKPEGGQTGRDYYHFDSRYELEVALSLKARCDKWRASVNTPAIEHIRPADRIAGWIYHPEKWHLNSRLRPGKKLFEANSTYSPDFFVEMDDGHCYYLEVKGFLRDDARVRLKRAVDLFGERDLRVRTRGYGELPAAEFLSRDKERRLKIKQIRDWTNAPIRRRAA